MSASVPQVRVLLQAIMADVGDGELDHYQPADPASFCLRLMVFGASEEGGPRDAFDLAVCTPRWLAEHFDDNGGSFLGAQRSADRALFGRGLLFVQRWDALTVRQAIEEAFAAGAGPDWGTAAERVGRLVPWEYEYRRDEQLDRKSARPATDGANGEESFVRIRLFPGSDPATLAAREFPGYADDGDCLLKTVEQRPGERVDDLVHRSLLELATVLKGVSPGTLVPQATLSWTPHPYQDGIILRPDEMAMLTRFGGAALIDTYTE